MMGGTVSFQLGFGFLRMACWISSVQRRQAARMALSFLASCGLPAGEKFRPESHQLVPVHSCEVAVCTRVRSPDDEHRPFVISDTGLPVTGLINASRPAVMKRTSLAVWIASLNQPTEVSAGTSMTVPI
jgi:hypothetical protein